MNYPVVLVVSSCSQTTALDVIASEMKLINYGAWNQSIFFLITDIRKIPNDDNVDENDGTAFYIHEINTKYYKTQIAFCPIESTDDVSETAKSNVEGFVIYFDSSDVSIARDEHKLVKYRP